MYYVTSNDGTKIAVYDYNPRKKQTVFLIHGLRISCRCSGYIIVSKELAEIQHKSIRGSKLMTLPDSGHGIINDQLERFNTIFMNAITEL